MKLLITGPAATGKSTRALERFTAQPGSFLVTPTATMAQHLRHQLARSGAAVRPSRIGSLTQFLDESDLPPVAPRFLLHILIEESLSRLRLERFERVREFPGVHAELARLIDEVPGFDPRDCGAELAALFTDVEDRLTGSGFVLRDRWLRAAAGKLRSGEIGPAAETIFDGFFTLGAAEIELIAALAGRGGVTLTLPSADPRLEELGFEVERLTGVRRSPQRALFAVATPEREAEEIARRILEHAARGRAFREMGVVLRSREPQAALLETTFRRFGIPVRAYFLDSLASHPTVAYLAGVVRAALAGWDHEALNALLRMPVSGVGATPAGDRFDFALREKLPGRGLPVPGIKDAPAVLNEFQRIASWRRERLTPNAWARRLQELGRLVAQPVMGERFDRDEVDAWRSTAAAVALFGEVAEQVAVLTGEAVVPLEMFWKRVETALALEQTPSQDRRRDVVHLMDVYEARQWELPVVFVCGLVERTFPKYHGEDPLLGDAARRRMGLASSAELQAEERVLFEIATSRATGQLILSYPRLDEKGEETLRSFFLGGAEAVDAGVRVRPKPRREVTQPVPGLVKLPAAKHHKLSATSIEDFLQCPFKFFARKTLKLRERPPEPRDRLNVLVQGSILHQALAERWRAPLLGADVLDQVFEMECARNKIPRTYRTEAVRLELLRHFESFLESGDVDLGWERRVEEPFEFELQPGLGLRGRIDRLEVGPGQQALVIDYKYSNKLKGRVEENEAGNLVQGGLYMLAAERAFGMTASGMLYCAVKGEVEWGGWHVPLNGLDGVGTLCDRERLRELVANAGQKVLETHAAILEGHAEVRPADRDKCAWCDFRDICRVETMERERASGAGQ